MTDGPKGFTDGIGAGCTGRHRRHGRTLAVVTNGDHTGSHVADHHRYTQWGHPVGTPAVQLFNFGSNGIQTADTGAKIHGYPFRRQGADDTALLHCLDSSTHGILGILVAAQSLTLIHVLHGIKVFDLCSQLSLVVRCIEISNGANTVIACNQIVPGCIHIAANRADNAHAGDNNSSVFTHIDLLTWRCRRQHGVLRRLHSLRLPDKLPLPQLLTLLPFFPEGSWKATDYFPVSPSCLCG